MSAADEKTSLGHFPEGPKWKFDEGVTAVFGDMLERSIPAYGAMRSAVDDVASSFLDRRSRRQHRFVPEAILDVGSSRGEAVARLVERYAGAFRFCLCDESPAMIDACRERFAGRGSDVVVVHQDLREGLPLGWTELALVTSVLSLQFLAVEHRMRLVSSIHRRLIDGGALILVEKVVGSGPATDELLLERYLAMKVANGYSPEEVERKRLSLEGVLVPLTAKWNEDLLRACGFREVECFWRCLNFCAWVGIK